MAFHFTPRPIEGLPKLTLEVNGFELGINGRWFNFSPLQDGGRIAVIHIDSVYLNPFYGQTLAQAPRVMQYIKRAGDRISLDLLLPYKHPAPAETRFPADMLVDANGPVLLPAYSNSEAWT